MTLFLFAIALLLAAASFAAATFQRPRIGLAVSITAVSLSSTLAIFDSARILLTQSGSQLALFRWPLDLGTATLAIDPLAAWFVLAVCLLAIPAAVYSWGYMRSEPANPSLAAYAAFLCLLLACLLLLLAAADLMLFLVSWELLSLAAFFLILFHDSQPNVRRGAWMYLIATHLGTAFCVLPLFAILAHHAGPQFASFATAMAASEPRLAALLFFLALIGFGTKAGFMPMHVWLPNAHPAAPAPVSALLSGAVIKVGIYALIRLLSWLPPLPISCGIAMLVLSILSGVLGVLYAIAQHDLKRLLAYHSVENIGIIGIGIGIGIVATTTHHPIIAALGYAGAILHVLNHALFKGLLFFSAGAVIHSTGTAELDRLGGLAKESPLNALFFLVASISICGLPPFNGFVSEWLIYASLFGAAIHLPNAPAALAVVSLTALAIMGGLALACFSKAFGVVFLGQPRTLIPTPHPTPFSMLAAMTMPASLCALIGILPILVLPPIASAIAPIVPLPQHLYAQSLHDSLRLTCTLTTYAAIFLASAAALLAFRRLIARHTPPDNFAPTWGCGYASPNPRMQYSASSFAWSIVDAFACLLWPHRVLQRPRTLFPNHGHLETHTPDVAEHDFFAPLFRGIGRLTAMIRTVSWSGQSPPSSTPIPENSRVGPFRSTFITMAFAVRRGRVHARLAYIAITLVIVLLVESFVTRRSTPNPTPTPAPAAHPGRANP